ncbi:MAG: Eco57I restriction-modification methylase domain-containing protein [Candidatus Didemnitutus sp.]|nr:Eco57I restriction-modification methylase domain-containing protein [Candidatus Didemnitutus sp.]
MIATSQPHTRERREQLGQFLTPGPLAEFMASMFGPLPRHVRLLDAGAGAGSLTRAFVHHCCARSREISTLHVTLYELDREILEALEKTLEECAQACTAAGIDFDATIHHADYIETMGASLEGGLFGDVPPAFDAAIANPPYRKIAANSSSRRALRRVGIETSNLYTGFIALTQRALAPGGQLVAITPRSFCNGPYFRPFREDFLRTLELHRLHLFESRKAAFREDRVLQENIIFHARKGRAQPPHVTISCSSGEAGAHITSVEVPFGQIVHADDPNLFIHIPSAPRQTEARQALAGFTATLAGLGLTVSTGRVVDYRLKSALRPTPEHGTVPLIYPAHFKDGCVHWPRQDSRKPNAIMDSDVTRPWLVPGGLYVLTKRFTSKEEPRRVVACLFDPASVPGDRVGFENHLNYFHADGQGLDRELALGLQLYLNSTLVDQYFRRFSGHTQVNATDLRSLAYPNLADLRALGRTQIKPLTRQNEIDQLLATLLHAHP